MNLICFLLVLKCVQANLYTSENKGYCKGIQICLRTLNINILHL